MNKSLRKLLCMMLAVLLLAALSAPALAATYGDYEYSISRGAATVTKYKGSGGNVTIPSTLGGYPVTSVGNYAFTSCDGLTSVTIPSGVTSIGESAFSGCSGLTEIMVDTGNGVYKSIDGVLFTASGNTLVCCPGGKTGSYVIPNGVTSIGESAFSGCSGLTSVTIPSGVTSFGWYAFSGCSGLTSVTIPLGVTDIGFYAFDGCSGLTSVTIPEGVAGIGWFAFSGCSGLTSVTIPSSATAPIGRYAFADCSGLTSMTIPSGVTSIEEGVFVHCSTLTSVTIPSSVTGIGWFAFADCTNLSDVYYAGSESQWKAIFIDEYNEPLLKAAIHFGESEDQDESVLDETVLRARMLTNSHIFSFYRAWDGPVRVMARNLDPTPSGLWYALENCTEIYYNAIKKGAASFTDVEEITAAELYEYLLLKMLDNREFQYYTLQDLFTPVSAISGERVDAPLLKKLAKKGIKQGTKLKSEDLADVKELCEAFLGSDQFLDVGCWDAILVPGKTIDEFITELVALYQLSTVSDARSRAIYLIWENASDPALKQAAWNIYSSIQSAKQEGIAYYASSATEKSIDSIMEWLIDKAFDVLCDIDPAVALWKKTAKGTMVAMDTLFLTDDVSTDTLYLLAMANLDNSIRLAIDKVEASFLVSNDLQSATGLIVLAELNQKEMLVGCDVADDFINHSERGELNWNGLFDAISMIQEGKLDFPAFLRWIFGDPNSSWPHLRESVSEIRKGIEHADYYNGVDVMLSLRDIKSTTPSAWAAEEVQKAISYGILPENMQNNYQTHITRLEFCLLLEYMIEGKTGKTVAEWIEEVGTQLQAPFDDALYLSVNNIARLGIIKGVGHNQFNPLGEITRQEAATMLYRTAAVLGFDTASEHYDEQGIAAWAEQGVDFVTSKEIMNGTGKGFAPQGKYTKEQAILTMVRFYENPLDG